MPKKNAAAQPQLQHPGLPDMEFDESTLPVEQIVNDGEAGKPVVKNAETEELRSQLDELKGRLAQIQEQNVNLMAKPVVRVAPQPPKPISWEGLPDPTYESEAYAKAVAERTINYTQEVDRYHQEVAQTQNQGARQATGLWNDFAVDYEDYTEDRDKVEFAAGKVLRKAQERGLDVDKYMYGHSTKFFEDVATEYDQIFGKPGTEADDDDGMGEFNKPQRRQAKPARRTAGIPGGQDGGQRNRPEPVERHDMFDDIRSFQRTHGFY